MLSFSSVTFVCFCFVFVFLAFITAAALRSIVPRYACAPAVTRNYLATVCVLFCLVSLEVSLFPSILYHCCFLFVLRIYCTFAFRMVLFYVVTTGWILKSACVRIQSIQTKQNLSLEEIRSILKISSSILLKCC